MDFAGDPLGNIKSIGYLNAFYHELNPNVSNIPSKNIWFTQFLPYIFSYGTAINLSPVGGCCLL